MIRRSVGFLPPVQRVVLATALLAATFTIVGVPSVTLVPGYGVEVERTAFVAAEEVVDVVDGDTAAERHGHEEIPAVDSGHGEPHDEVLHEEAGAEGPEEHGHDEHGHDHDAADPSSDDRVATEPIETGEFDLIGVRVDEAPIGDEHVLVRTRVDGQWSDWEELAISIDEGPDPSSEEAAGESGVTSEPLWVGDADAYQLSAPEEVLESDEADVLLVREGRSRVVVEAESTDAGAITPNAPPMTTRGGWGARAPKRSISVASSLKIAAVHHTVTSNSYSAGQVPGIIRGIQAYHMDGRGWSDIGYNFIVDRFGRVFEGRHNSANRLSIGAHAGGFNTGAVGVASLGDNQAAVPGGSTQDAIAEVISWKFANHGVNPATRVNVTSGGSTKYPAGQVVNLPRIIGHRDVSATSCPGTHLFARLGSVRTLVAQKWPVKTSPQGGVWKISGGRGRLLFNGWALDPESDDPVDVHIYIDGRGYNIGPASEYRAPVDGLFPNTSGDHGFTAKIGGLSPGPHDVCIYGINLGAGGNQAIHCSRPTVLGGSPIGKVNRITAAPGGVLSMHGWALDPDTDLSPDIHVWINGIAGFNLGPTDVRRADVTNTYPLFTGNYGFEWSTSGLKAGTNEVCVFAINRKGTGGNKLLSCHQVSVPSGSPIGRLDAVGGAPDRQLYVAGWTLDPDTVDSNDVHVWIGGKGFNLGPADKPRADVGAFFRGYGDDHGFSTRVSGAPRGRNAACAFGIDKAGPGGNTLLGCRWVTIPYGSPFGSVDGVHASPDGTIDVVGWLVDPDTVAPGDVHVYVGSAGYNMGAADEVRGDIAAAFPHYGSRHGFRVTLPATFAPGSHDVCVFAVDASGGDGNSLLSCRTVEV